ncbi:MAG: [protein-PII] uridylyltransferase [Gammaproteobacteria bacterium]|nr:[protein-PII] uridylyltransferase [Gammaproteobacteria bacterium]
MNDGLAQVQGDRRDEASEPLATANDVHAPLACVRDAIAAAQSRLESRFRQGEPVDTLVETRSRFVDGILVLAWRRFELDDRDARHALVAVGGYGRGELHPGSDIDLLILARRAMRDGESDRIRSFLAFLWDIGLAVGNSVRTVRECVNEARRDVTVATNLMEGRLVCGSADLFARMRERTGPERIWSSRRFFEAKMAEQRERHRKFDDTSHNLEPNVKEGPGGLRDIQTIGWVARRHFGAETLAELVDHGILTTEELGALQTGRRFLWRVRFALHVLTGRAENRLLFDHQRQLAQMLGFEDDGERLGVERLMKRYYREVMELSRLNEMLLGHFEEVILHIRRRDRVKPINRRFQAVNGYLEVIRKDVFRRHPFALLEVFLLLQQHPDVEGVRASTIRLIRANRYRIDDRFRADIRARSLFLEILRQPRGINHELRRMHRYGILGAYLPVFERVAGQMQYDLFHVYTVDEHSLCVVRNLRMFADPARYHEFPHCADIFARLPKPELVYIAGLFHDVAKGRRGDHSELGSDLVAEFCTLHGFGTYDTGLVAWLVRHHLLMSMTAQRRDISDPAVVSEFAQTVGDHVHLDYLYLLTIADIRGTDPGLWNDWKDALLLDLYRSTVRALMRGLENPIERAELVRETREEAGRLVTGAGSDAEAAETLWDNFGDDYFLRHSADEIHWHTSNILRAGAADIPLVLVRDGRGGIEIFVYAPDREFLFAASASILGRLGLTVLDSRIITANHGMTLDSYVVEDIAASSAGDSLHAQIRIALQLGLRNPADVPRRVRRLAKRQLKHFTIPVEVNFTRDASDQHTVMEVIAADRPGLLARIGWALADARVRIRHAKIATFGERAEDVFYVTDARNRPLAETRLAEVYRSVRAALEPG